MKSSFSLKRELKNVSLSTTLSQSKANSVKSINNLRNVEKSKKSKRSKSKEDVDINKYLKELKTELKTKIERSSKKSKTKEFEEKYGNISKIILQDEKKLNQKSNSILNEKTYLELSNSPEKRKLEFEINENNRFDKFFGKDLFVKENKFNLNLSENELKQKKKKMFLIRNTKYKIKEEEKRNSSAKKFNKNEELMKKLKNEKPLYERYKEVIDKKQNQLKILRKFYNESAEKTNLTTDNNLVTDDKEIRKQRFKLWLWNNNSWQKIKNEKLTKIREKNDNKEEENINFNYLKVLTESPKRTNTCSSDPQFKAKKKEKLNKLLLDSTPDFTPKLNPRLPSYLQGRNVISRVGSLNSIHKTGSIKESEASIKEKRNIYLRKMKKNQKRNVYPKLHNRTTENSLDTVKQTHWTQVLDSLCNEEVRTTEASPYKINLQHGCSWQVDKENNVFFDEKKKGFLKELAKKKFFNYEEFFPKKDKYCCNGVVKKKEKFSNKSMPVNEISLEKAKGLFF